MVLPLVAALRGGIRRTVSADPQHNPDAFGIDDAPETWAEIEEEINRRRLAPHNRERLLAALRDVRVGALE